MVNNKELFEKRNKMAEATWETFPEALQDLILTMFHSNGEYGVSDAIRYLREHKVSLSEHSGTAKLTYLRWVDKVFRNMCHLMFEFEDSWGRYGEDIEEILLCADGYLRDLAADYDHLSVMSKDELSFYDSTDLVILSQDFDMFFCALYWYKEEHEKFEERLERIFEATKRNITYLLQHEYAAELKLDFWDMDDFLPMEFYFWENIAWLYHGGGAVAFPQRLIQIYEEYVDFLYALEVGRNWKTRNELVIKAEHDLQFLYEMDIDRIKDEVSEDEYPDYIEQCEQKVQESKERVDAIRKPYAININQESEDDCEEDDERDWEAVWSEASKSLSKKIGQLSFGTWIEPLSLYYVDKHNMIMYLLWTEQEKLINYLEKDYLAQIEDEIKIIAPEIEHLEILTANVEMQNQHYHKKWSDKTNFLRELLLAYKTTPAVIFIEPDNDEKEPYMIDPSRTEIVEGYAHDPETGAFTEKVIAISIKKPRNIDDDFFVPEEEIPF